MINLEEWTERARRDDVLDNMVPSELRVILGEVARLRADNLKLDAQLNVVLGHMDEGAITDLRKMLDAATRRVDEGKD